MMFNDMIKILHKKLIAIASYVSSYIQITLTLSIYTFYVIVFITLNDNQLKIDMRSEN